MLESNSITRFDCKRQFLYICDALMN